MLLIVFLPHSKSVLSSSFLHLPTPPCPLPYSLIFISSIIFLITTLFFYFLTHSSPFPVAFVFSFSVLSFIQISCTSYHYMVNMPPVFQKIVEIFIYLFIHFTNIIIMIIFFHNRQAYNSSRHLIKYLL